MCVRALVCVCISGVWCGVSVSMCVFTVCKPYALHPTPYTLHPTPYTLHPKRSERRQRLREHRQHEKEKARAQALQDAIANITNGLGFRVWGWQLGSRVQGLGFRV